MRRLFLASLTALLAFFALTARAEVIDIDNGELAKLMEKHVPVIDIRTAPEWQETGVVPGSHLITFFDEQGRADPAAWLAKASRVAKPDQPVILICRSGNRTQAVARFLSSQVGYTKVYNVKSGIRTWIGEGRSRQSLADAKAACEKAKNC